VASYVDLSPGSYKLLVNATDNRGLWSDNVKEIGIVIRPPFWAPIWAYLVYVLIFVFLVHRYFSFREKRMEQKLSFEKLEALRLKELDELKDRFFSNVTHEFRTPLTLIISPLDKLLSDGSVTSGPLQQTLQGIQKNSRQLLALINEFLDFSKLSNGQMQINLSPGDLTLFVENYVKTFETAAQDKKVALSFTSTNVEGLHLFDSDKWSKIIINLVGNALKFTPEKGSIVVSLQGVTLGKVMLVVWDNGPGISTDQQEKIFERFYQEESSTLTIGVSDLSYGTSAAAARTNLTGTKGWTISDDAASGADCLGAQYFVTRWNLAKSTGSGDNKLTFRVQTLGTVNYIWKEVSPGSTSGSGTFTGTGENTATITGLRTGSIIDLFILPANFTGIRTRSTLDQERLVDVRQWGTAKWSTMESAFFGCSNVQVSATDVPNLRGVSDLIALFALCETLNGPTNIGTWNTSNVTRMNLMFSLASSFNQPLGNWDTGNVTNMSSMFYGARKFNQPIDNWNTSSVKDMSIMFGNASTFNQPIGSWNTTNVTDMSITFSSASAFNQPIGTWNTENVTDMGGMFSGARSFNQPIGSWNTAKVTDMGGMFSSAVAFNKPIGTWNTANVTNMNVMFSAALAFNQPIGSWNTANVTTMRGTFSTAIAFNQPIGTWNTTNVTTMKQMFYYAVKFNQPVDAWDTEKVINMDSIFHDASAFNQSVGSWKLNPNVNLDFMFLGSGLDCSHYSTTLNGWDTNPSTPNGRTLTAPGMFYGTNAVAARNNLIGPKGWTITQDAASGSEYPIVLPVTLVSFSGKKTVENQTILTWVTAEEKDFDYFEIQRASDAKSFEKIGKIKGETENELVPLRGFVSIHSLIRFRE
jgi:surface protein